MTDADDSTELVPDPKCGTKGCPNYVESSEDYCSDCLDKQQDDEKKRREGARKRKGKS